MSFDNFRWKARHYLRFTGRTGVKEYLIILLLILGLGQLVGYAFARGDRGLLWVLLLLAAILIWPMLAATVRRLHDLNLSGWWIVFLLLVGEIPFVGIAIWLGLLIPAKKGPNRFGLDPRDAHERDLEQQL
ncbi:MAG: DUF805 domain-containing protein [Sphingomonadaceae bacterium]